MSAPGRHFVVRKWRQGGNRAGKSPVNDLVERAETDGPKGRMEMAVLSRHACVCSSNNSKIAVKQSCARCWRGEELKTGREKIYRIHGEEFGSSRG